MKKLLFTFFLFAFVVAASAQEKETEDSLTQKAYQVVTQFFEYMNNADTVNLRKIAYPKIRMLTTYTDQYGKPQLEEESFDEFLESIASLKDVEWREEVSEIDVQVDGSLAQVWMYYRFYYNGRMSHIGVNTMQLFHDGSEWLIFYVADTRHR